MYKIHFIKNDGTRYSHYEFASLPGRTVLYSLEENLYILQELTPVHREWATELIEFGTTTFTYHNLEFVHVEMRGDKFIITDF